MLTHLRDFEVERIQNRLGENPACSVRISALLKAYGTEQPFLSVWHQQYDTVLARLENSFFVYPGRKPDYEELAFFLRFNPYFRSITGDAKTIAGIAAFFSQKYSIRHFVLMTLNSDKLAEKPYFPVEAAPNLRALYDVICQATDADFSVGEFPSFYVDMNHRIRHGCARAYLLTRDGQSASACLVSVESDGAGLVSGVATVPQMRHLGYAAAVVRAACHDLLQARKLPVLECLQELTWYYAGLGFDKIGDTATLAVEDS